MLEVVAVGGSLEGVLGAGLKTALELVLSASHHSIDLPEQSGQRSSRLT